MENRDDKLAVIIASLASMGTRIADPARHEKVLSYLKSEAARLGPHSLISESSYRALNVVEQCIGNDDQRLVSVAFRFVGYLIELDDSIFPIVYDNHRDILASLVEVSTNWNTTSALLYGCVETWSSLCNSTTATEWILRECKISQIFLRAFCDDSIYVSTALIGLMKTLITVSSPIEEFGCPDAMRRIAHHELLASLTVSGNIQDLLKAAISGRDWRLYVSADLPRTNESLLEKQTFVLNLVSELIAETENRASCQFIRDSDLVTNSRKETVLTKLQIFEVVASYAQSNDRSIQSRVLDIIRNILKSDSLCAAFGSGGFDGRSTPARSFISKILVPFFTNNSISVTKVSQMFRAISAALRKGNLDTQFSDWYLQAHVQILNEALSNARSASAIKNFDLDLDKLLSDCVDVQDQSLPEALQKISDSYLLQVKETFRNSATRRYFDKRDKQIFIVLVLDIWQGFLDIFDIGIISAIEMRDILFQVLRYSVSEDMFTSAPRVGHLLLRCCGVFIDSVKLGPEELKVSVCAALRIIGNVDVTPALSSDAFNMLLSVFKRSALRDVFSSDLRNILTEAIMPKFYDMDWDIRVIVIEFVRRLFDSLVVVEVQNYGLTFVEPLVKRMGDAEVDVRIAALTALTVTGSLESVKNNVIFQDLTGHQTCWLHLRQSGLEVEIFRRLFNECLQDSESLVRRASLDFLAAFLSSDFCKLDLVIMTDDEAEAPERRLCFESLELIVCRDSDSEVRIRGLRLLSTLLDIVACGKAEQSDWFSSFNFDTLVMSRITDSSRMVRGECLSVITKALRILGVVDSDASPPKKLKLTPREYLLKILAELQSVDLQSLEHRSRAEHLYEEALDVGQWLVQESDALNEGNNVLQCYDC
ncbi:hypothetical protein HDU83_002634 [Entophlyctis luteolus]|nr:hypothetical protein HDU83_002634 [Entophlyctis luteolus]